jgi:exosortase C (VPDSG-CTERM-specific)
MNKEVLSNANQSKKTGEPSPFSGAVGASRKSGSTIQKPFARFVRFGVFLIVLALLFLKPLVALVLHAAGSELHSHILLVPFISAYLMYVDRKQLPRENGSPSVWLLIPLALGLLALAAGLGGLPMNWHLGKNDVLSSMALSFYCFVLVGGFLFLGGKCMAATMFPFAFLIFMVPLPEGVVEWLETGSKLASAEAADWFFHLSGTPVLRDGTVFQLPGMVVEVAQECSGIRSSLVLFITGLLAAHLLLKSPWRRAVLVAVVIPLGILRNGFRILVISLLCVHVGPRMIHSDIHHRGGPVFFALSLIPLFLLLWWLRRGEAAVRSGETVKRNGEGEPTEAKRETAGDAGGAAR